MKKLIPMLLVLALLAGCSAQETGTEEKGPPAGEMTLPESAYTGDDAGECACTMTTEWTEYDPSVGAVWYILKNESDRDVETGADYQLETLGENGAWHQVPLVEDAAWYAIAYALPAGGSIAMACHLSMFDYDFSDGTYRIVKEVEGQTCTAEFHLKTGAAISADTPYGFAPLEDLPEEYGVTAGAAEGCPAFNWSGSENLEAVGTFLEKVRLGIPCQLRTIQDYGENVPMVTDVIYENDHFHWRMRQQGAYYEQRFSYLVTDGTDVYFSNGADWETAQAHAGKWAIIVPAEGLREQNIALVEEMTALRLEGNTARYKVWSHDGEWAAALTENPTEFSISGPDGGQVCDLRDYELTKDLTSIQDLSWNADYEHVLVLIGNESGLGAGRHRNIIYYDVEKFDVLDILTPGS